MKWILILEKDERAYRYLERILTRLGYRPYRASNISQGLHFMAESMPDALICGELASGSDPLAFCKLIKQDPATKNIPALLLTPDKDTNLKIEAHKAGYAEVVYRPLSIRSLFEKLELCLSSNRRSHIRAPMSFPVDIFNRHNKQTLETCNFGEGGMYLHTQDPAPKRTDLDIQFKLPGFDTLLYLRGKVVHACSHHSDENPAGMGIQFTHLTGSLIVMLCIYMENFLAMTTPLVTTQGRLWCAEHGDVRPGDQIG